MMVAKQILRILALAGFLHFAVFQYDANIIFKLYHEKVPLSRDAQVWAASASGLDFFVSSLLTYAAYEGKEVIQNTFRVCLSYGIVMLLNAVRSGEVRHHLIYLALFWAVPGFLVGALGWGLDDSAASSSSSSKAKKSPAKKSPTKKSPSKSPVLRRSPRARSPRRKGN